MILYICQTSEFLICMKTVWWHGSAAGSVSSSPIRSWPLDNDLFMPRCVSSSFLYPTLKNMSKGWSWRLPFVDNECMNLCVRAMCITSVSIKVQCFQGPTTTLTMIKHLPKMNKQMNSEHWMKNKQSGKNRQCVLISWVRDWPKLMSSCKVLSGHLHLSHAEQVLSFQNLESHSVLRRLKQTAKLSLLFHSPLVMTSDILFNFCPYNYGSYIQGLFIDCVTGERFSGSAAPEVET